MPDRYAMQSEHVRGERRWYYIVDMQTRTERHNFGADRHDLGSHDGRVVQRRCDKLNGKT